MSRIIIAEDNVMIGLAVKADLTRQGFEVLGPFLRVAPALSAVGPSGTSPKDVGADLALVDIDLQHGDSGIELARALRQRGVPAIFMTGQVEQAKGASDAALGALGKPFPSEALIESVRAALAYARDGVTPDPISGVIWF